MNNKTNTSRAGITLMEVLISIGILSVGLTAVITIIPAAGSQAQKALTESSKANVGLTAIDDAITRGILSPPGAPPFVVDPVGNAPFAGLALESLSGLNPGIAADEVFRSQDDVVYTLDNSGQEDPPQPLFYAGNTKRISEGVYSWLATLVPQVGENYLLSVVSFHRRDQTSPTSQNVTDVSGNAITCSWTGTNGAFRETFPRGSVVLLYDTLDEDTNGNAELDPGEDLNNNGILDVPTWEWRRIIFPSFGDGSTCQLMFDADVTVNAGTTTVYAFKGAVGVAERLVRLEGTSPWSQ